MLISSSVRVRALISLAVAPVFVVVYYAKLSSKLLDFPGTQELKFYHPLALSPVLERGWGVDIGKCLGVFEPPGEQKVCLTLQGRAQP